MVLTYHEIASEPCAYTYSITTHKFAEHMDAVLAAGSEVPLITFDDGHASHHRYAAPALERRGLRGLFFVTAGWIEQRAGFMDWAQSKDLAAAGHDVQSHGWSHRLLTHCTPEELEVELARSRQTLEDRLGRVVDAISMPGGRFNRRVLEACLRAGYTRLFTSDAFAGDQCRGPARVRGRYMVRRNTSPELLLELVQGRGPRWVLERIEHTVKREVRHWIGDGAYAAVWRWAGAAKRRAEINNEYR